MSAQAARPSLVALFPIALLLGVFATLTIPLTVHEIRRQASASPPVTSEAFDQDRYHLQVIRHFARQIPRVDLVRYPSATTPGYHLLQAIVHRVFGGRVWPMLAVNLLIGFALIGLTWRLLKPGAGAWGAAALTAPLACSSYIVGSTVWLTTDALGWLCVVGAVGLALMPARSSVRLGVAGLAATAAVLVRQIHLWSAAPVLAAGVLLSPLARRLPSFARDRESASGPGRWPTLVVGVGGFLLPVAAVVAFALAWGGLIPVDDEIRSLHGTGPTPAGPAFMLAMLGIFAPAAVLAIPGALRGALRSPACWSAGAVVWLLSAIPLTGFDPEAQRQFGWVWRVVDVIGRSLTDPLRARSPVIVALAGIGGMSVAALWLSARGAGRSGTGTMLVLTMLGFTLAQSANPAVWQRYYEPAAILFIALLAAIAFDPASPPRKLRLVPLVLVALMQFALTIITTHREVFAGG